MNIQYYTKHVYGEPLRYPIDATVQAALHCLNGHKTLTDGDMAALKDLGHIFEEVFIPRDTPLERIENKSEYLACIWCGGDLPKGQKFAKYCSEKCRNQV